MHDVLRGARIAYPALLLLLAASSAAAGSNPRLIEAQPRRPQATIQGTGLQDFFDGVGESIVSARDQVDVGLLGSTVSDTHSFSVSIELRTDANGVSSGIYNGYELHPVLMQLFPATASANWFAVVSYRDAPTRALVYVFSADSVLVGATTYPGADRNGIGVYVDGPGGTFFSQDARNPGGAPQLLFYRGTGLNYFAAWMAAEAQPLGTASDADHDDVVWFMNPANECLFCEPSDFTPVHHSSWGELKSRFR